MLDFLFKNIGKKIKALAKWAFIVLSILSISGGFAMVILGAVYYLSSFIAFGFVCMIVSPLIWYISSFVLYGFGELIDKTSQNEQNTKKILIHLDPSQATEDQGEYFQTFQNQGQYFQQQQQSYNYNTPNNNYNNQNTTQFR